MNFTKNQVIDELGRTPNLKLLIAGILAGYTDASIIHYIRKRFDEAYTYTAFSDKLFNGTGLIRCPSEEDVDPIIILTFIKENRLIPIPFPNATGYLASWANTEKHLADSRFLKRFSELYPIVKKYI